MMNKKTNVSYGVNTNVSLDPTANAASNQSINNNIIIHGDVTGGRRPITEPSPTTAPETRTLEAGVENNASNTALDPSYVIYNQATPSTYPSICPQVDPQCQTRSQLNINQAIKDILYDITTQILLSQNKTLMANIITKQNIIIKKSDLERVISTKINKQCSIIIDDIKQGCGCVGKIIPIDKIAAIRIVDDNSSVDFKSVYNADYNDLTDNFKLNLEYVCV